MSDFDTFGITLPVRDWKTLLTLAQRADRSPSDYLRMVIRREAAQATPSAEPTPDTGPVKDVGVDERNVKFSKGRCQRIS